MDGLYKPLVDISRYSSTELCCELPLALVSEWRRWSSVLLQFPSKIEQEGDVEIQDVSGLRGKAEGLKENERKWSHLLDTVTVCLFSRLPFDPLRDPIHVELYLLLSVWLCHCWRHCDLWVCVCGSVDD